jgi:hypothetical protein
MPERHDDYDGSDIFWPGYVDATTNLILNLLFLLTILMVAVFMFALELGRSSKVEPANPPIASVQQDAEVAGMATNDLSDAISMATTDLSDAISIATTTSLEAASVATDDSSKAVSMLTVDFSESVSMAMTDFSEAVAMAVTDSVQEMAALKLEVQRLNALLSQQVSDKNQAGGLAVTVDATSRLSKPKTGLDKTLSTDLEVLVRFKDEAVAFTPEEHDRLLESLKPIVESGKTSIYVEVPTGFSEAKRMGFYRAMSVRNLLIEMKLPQENIDVSVIEGKNNANASVVRVRSR